MADNLTMFSICKRLSMLIISSFGVTIDHRFLILVDIPPSLCIPSEVTAHDAHMTHTRFNQPMDSKYNILYCYTKSTQWYRIGRHNEKIKISNTDRGSLYIYNHKTDKLILIVCHAHIDAHCIPNHVYLKTYRFHMPVGKIATIFHQ